jgi:hypothetical protein
VFSLVQSSYEVALLTGTHRCSLLGVSPTVNPETGSMVCALHQRGQLVLLLAKHIVSEAHCTSHIRHSERPSLLNPETKADTDSGHYCTIHDHDAGVPAGWCLQCHSSYVRGLGYLEVCVRKAHVTVRHGWVE